MEMWKGFKKFRSLPCVERSGEILAWAENAELLEFMVRMVDHNLVAEVFLKLAEQAGCEARLLFEVGSVKSPLMLKEGLQVLAEGSREALYPEPFCERCLEREKVSGFAGVESAVHAGVNEIRRCSGNVSWSRVRM